MTRQIFTCCGVPIYAALKDGWDTDSREMDFWFSLSNENQESYENGLFDVRTVSPSITGRDYMSFIRDGDRAGWLEIVKVHIETALRKGNLRPPEKYRLMVATWHCKNVIEAN